MQEAATKLVVGPGVTLIGFLTLNDVALVAGILCSLVIAAHTSWKFWTEFQDRRARLK